VRYNQLKDQLLLSASSDSCVGRRRPRAARVCGSRLPQVALCSVASLASDYVAPAAAAVAAAAAPVPPDGLIALLEEHEDRCGACCVCARACRVTRRGLSLRSVYSAEWSSADPWIFASLSYDGRLVVNHVPRDTKFSLLLSGSQFD